MKVPVAQPIQFTTADVLDPGDLNALYTFAQDAVDDVGSKRFQHAALIFPFVESVAVPYTNALATEELTYRFTCPSTCVIESAFFHGNLTSAAELKVSITTAAGATPSGATVPYLTSAAAVASAAVDTQDVNPDRVLLVAGTEYKIVVSSSGAFTLNRFDVILHCLIDRFTPAGTSIAPAFAPTLFTDNSAADATVVAANNTALSTQAAVFASNKAAATPTLFVRHNILSGTSVNLRAFAIPRLDSARAQAKLIRIYLYALMDTTGGSTVTATLADQTGATITTVSANVAGVTFASADSGALSTTLVSATTSITTNTANDYTLTFANASGVVNCRKVYALVWISR